MREIRLDIPRALAQDPWFKIVDFLQQNWAVVLKEESMSRIVFYDDLCGVFDEVRYPSFEEAVSALKRNGFSKYRDDPEAEDFVALPQGEFHLRDHPNGLIYSSGRFWSA